MSVVSPLPQRMSTGNTSGKRIIRISENVWRQAASDHQKRIHDYLKPGLTPADHVLNCGLKRRNSRRNQRLNNNNNNNADWFTALDPKHPVYNFLIEYYGLKGVKGPKRLARWSPNPNLLLQPKDVYSMLEELQEVSALSRTDDTIINRDNYSRSRSCTHEASILLEGASEEDLGGILHLRGAMIADSNEGYGISYSPYQFFQQKNEEKHRQQAIGLDDSKQVSPITAFQQQKELSTLATPFLWYKSVLEQTLKADPVMHCHGLHEWAMQYHPVGSEPPPSAKYQEHLPLRVSRDIINETVERKGISCTHVDALRYFAPAAGPLNSHGATLQRLDQLRLEQPACVHAHMDLLKLSLKLQPFIDPILIQRVLYIALESRKLDIAASPYDVSAYYNSDDFVNTDFVVPVETKEGRALYRKAQGELMEKAKPIREDLLHAYNIVLQLAFEQSDVSKAIESPSPERYAKTEPGGLPWRKNLI